MIIFFREQSVSLYRQSEFSECARDNTRFASIDRLPSLVLSLSLSMSILDLGQIEKTVSTGR